MNTNLSEQQHDLESLAPGPTSSGTRPTRRSTLAYFGVSLALGLSAAAMGPTLPGLAEQTHTTLSQVSSLFSARALGVLLGSFLAGRAYDRKPGHPILLGAVAVTILLLALIPGISFLWLLTTILFGVGIAEGIMNVGINTLLIWQRDNEAGPYINFLHFCFGVGAFFSPILIAQVLLRWENSSWAFWVVALAFLPLVVMFWGLPSPRRQVHASQDIPVAGRTLMVVLTCVFLFLYVGAEVTFSGWLYTFALAEKITGPATAAYITSAFWATLTTGRLLSIPLIVRFRPKTILMVDLLGSMASLTGILILPPSLPVLWIGTACTGFFMASIFSTTFNLASRRMLITGNITSWFFVGSSLGSSFLPWLVGQLLIPMGPRVLMAAVLIDLAIAFLVFLLMARSPAKSSISSQ